MLNINYAKIKDIIDNTNTMKINLIEYFERTVAAFPNKLAIADNDSQLTFNELKKKAKAMAGQIAVIDLINRPIGIFLPKGNDALVAMIATLYSGNCYAPLDVKNPIARIKSIFETLQPICIITNSTYIGMVKEYGSEINILNIDELDYDTVISNSVLNYQKCIDVDPAYIIHTSGSTGVPKGVVISHRSIFNYINWAIDTFNITEKETIGNQAPFIFDNSTLDIYLMVFTGATLYIIPEQQYIFPAKLLDFLNEKRINFVFWVPSVLVNVANLNLLTKLRPKFLKKVLFAGEVMPTKHLNYWINNLDDNVIFANLYGPTEITVDCTFYIVDRVFDDNEVLPIGKPCRNSDILILNAKNEIVKIGEHGELCVRGSSLALGYWNNFDKTNEVFVQNPLNKVFPEKIYRTGDIVFLNDRDEIIFVGRKDFQIKHLGYRIELGEIEHAILSVFNSISACVLYDNLKSEIVLAYESPKEISNSQFKIKLSKVLLKYMIPTRYLRIDKMPLTPSGKIDRSYFNAKINEIP